MQKSLDRGAWKATQGNRLRFKLSHPERAKAEYANLRPQKDPSSFLIVIEDGGCGANEQNGRAAMNTTEFIESWRIFLRLLNAEPNLHNGSSR
jgi:hypothetical protein